MEWSCANCGEKVEVSSLLAAAAQPCSHCGQLLMGPLEHGKRMARPPSWEAPPPDLPRTGSSAGAWLGMLAGLIGGPLLAAGIAQTEPVLTWPVRNALLGALAGVLLSPILAVSSFISLRFLPFTLEAYLGEGVWSRVARAIHEHTPWPLFLPFLYLFGLPMAVCGFGGSRMTPTDPSLASPAALGAALLGVVLGGIGGGMLGSARRGP